MYLTTSLLASVTLPISTLYCCSKSLNYQFKLSISFCFFSMSLFVFDKYYQFTSIFAAVSFTISLTKNFLSHKMQISPREPTPRFLLGKGLCLSRHYLQHPDPQNSLKRLKILKVTNRTHHFISILINTRNIVLQMLSFQQDPQQ